MFICANLCGDPLRPAQPPLSNHSLKTRYDLIAVGGGTGGLVTAAGAAYLGLNAAIVEKNALGGDCLWTGCVPSKALIASGRLAHQIDRASGLGLSASPTRHEFRAVMERMRAARRTVAHHDDPERFRKMGVGVHLGAARFLDPETLEVEGTGRLRARRFVIATGAVAAIPPIPGLAAAGYWSYENVFDENELPVSMAVLGGGPIGAEFAQILSRLGAQVTLIEMAPAILTGEDADVSAFMREQLQTEGIEVRTGTAVARVEVAGNRRILHTAAGERVEAEGIFVATGRRPFTDGLGLEDAGVETVEGAVRVDPWLGTSARSIRAVGDVTGAMQFTHVADQMARVALRNSVLPFRARIRYDNVPRVTYTDPEVAHVGMGEEEAAAEGGQSWRYPFDDLDRAIVDGRGTGFVKLSTDRKGRILGATIVAHGAGELIVPVALARAHGITASRISNSIFPYPTMAEGIKRAASEFQRSRLDSASGRLLKRVIRWFN